MRKKIILPIAIISIIIIGFIVYAGIASAGSKPIKVVERFEDAIVQGDTKKLVKVLTPGDPLLKINETTASQLMTYYQENPSAFADEVDQLKFDADMWTDEDTRSTSFAYADDEVDKVLSFVKREDKQGLFGNYAIEVQPLYFKVRTNQKDTTFHLNEEEILTAKVDYYDKVLGPYMPGTYEVSASFDGDYVSLASNKEVNLPEDHDEEIDLTLDVQYIYPESNDPEAYLYVNGKDTGKQFKNMDYFGPVASDGSMTVQAKKETEWGPLTSDLVTVTAGDSFPSVPLNGLYIYPTTNVSDAKLLVNDNNTGISIEEAAMYGYGPLPFEGALTMQAEKVFPWGTYRSAKKPVVQNPTWDEEDLFIDALDEQVQEQIMSDVNVFLQTMTDAYNANDISLMKQTTPYMTDYFSDLVVDIDYYGELIEAVYDLDSFYLSENENGDYQVNFAARFLANEVYYEMEPEPYEYTWDFVVLYDEASESWVVDDFMGSSYFDGENIREFTF